MPVSLSVLSWNLFGPPTAPDPLERMRRAARKALDERYELVLLQEVWTREQLRVIGSVLHAEYELHHSGSQARWILGLKGGLLACVRKDSAWRLVADPEFQEFGTEASPLLVWQGDGLADKGVQKLRIQHAESELVVRVLNTHLQSDYSPHSLFDFPGVRRAQLDDLSRAAGSRELPTVAFGDLNLAPGSENYRQLLGFWDDLSAAERQRCQCGTHDGDEPGAADWIDYVLGRDTPDWTVAAEVTRHDREQGGEMISDHDALSAALSFERVSDASIAVHAAALAAARGPSTRRSWLAAMAYLATRTFAVRMGGSAQ